MPHAPRRPGALLAALAALVIGAMLMTRHAAAEGAANDADYARDAAALVEPYRESGLFSGTILVAQGDRVLFRGAYGLANREWTIAVTPDTHFRIGSLTKTFTAAAILQLAEAGKLSLDDRVRRFVPSAPAAWDRVSLRQLLNHTSGIINFTALPDYYARISRIERTPQEIVALTEGEPLLFEPGTQMSYSNTNYVLLGMAIEAASGRPYAEYLRERLLAPLGLKETGYDDVSQILPRRAAGYRFGQAHWRNAPPMASSIAYAAGGLYSTIDDLLGWTRALFGGRVVGPDSLKAMTEDGGRGYGLGWYVGKAHDRRLFSHGGAVSGFLAILDVFPDDDLTVIVLANNENAPVQKIARELSALRFGRLDPPDSIALEDLILDRYAGTYQLGPRFFLTLTRDGGHLRVRGTGQPPITFLPESDRTFFSPVIDARITLDTEPDGRPNGLVLHQNGRDRVAARIDRLLAAPRPEHREVAIDRARLAGLAGRYALAQTVALTVRVENGRLTAQIDGQPRFELVPEGERDFFVREVDAQVTFETDPAGRATGLVLHQHGLDTPAPRLDGEEAAVRPGPPR